MFINVADFENLSPVCHEALSETNCIFQFARDVVEFLMAPSHRVELCNGQLMRLISWQLRSYSLTGRYSFQNWTHDLCFHVPYTWTLLTSLISCFLERANDWSTGLKYLVITFCSHSWYLYSIFLFSARRILYICIVWDLALP